MEVKEIKEIIVSYLEEAGEYCGGSDVPCSAEAVKQILSLLVGEGWFENMPSDEEIKKLYPLFLEDWVQFGEVKKTFPSRDKWEKGGKR